MYSSPSLHFHISLTIKVFCRFVNVNFYSVSSFFPHCQADIRNPLRYLLIFSAISAFFPSILTMEPLTTGTMTQAPANTRFNADSFFPVIRSNPLITFYNFKQKYNYPKDTICKMLEYIT